jgi:hypothetical protein
MSAQVSREAAHEAASLIREDVFAVAQGLLGVLINDDRDVLDVLVAPAFYVVIKDLLGSILDRAAVVAQAATEHTALA